MQAAPIKALIQHARNIAGPLCESLAQSEARPTGIAPETLRMATHAVWLMEVDDVEHGRADLSSPYLADVHARLATAAGLADSGGFSDDGQLPILPDGTRESWTRLAHECGYDEDTDVDGAEEEYALAQLRWGGHVRTFPLSLSRLAMNIVRLRRGQHAVYPPLADHERLLRFLEHAGPDTYDADAGLRGIAREYAEQQVQDGFDTSRRRRV